METVQTRAYAKINLGLRILRRREDGFHELRTLFQTISLADTVRLSFGRGRGVRLEGVRAEPGVGWPAMAEADNLAVRAAVLARQAWGVGGAIGVHLHKRIPLGAGLGGGSADAAAALRYAGFTDVAAAASLGADVPFCLRGGRAKVGGIGEELTALA
ncbi:MAG: 4-(cytidine 5'-diphospho)-2-C-methyl-D-erythritol kinase, partial [Terriglobales bacterium]